MKKLLAILAAAAITAMAGTAMAADSGDLEVTAEVLGVCTMTGGSLDFGELDPTNPQPVPGSSEDVTVTCTNGTTYGLTGGEGDNYDGSNRRLHRNAGGTTANDYIVYSLTIPDSGSGTGSEETVTVTGAITAAAYTYALAGEYSDTVVLSVTP